MSRPTTTPTANGGATAQIPDHMRAVVQDRYGDADVLRVEQVSTPQVGPREVLVEVHAAGLDRGTWHLMTGLPVLLRLLGFGVRRPKRRTPGLDLAGVVVAVGEDVTRFGVGDEVFGIGIGSFASYAVAEEDKLAPKPANLTFVQAAVVPISGLTAIQGLRDAGRLEPGQHVLVLGASGGVGSYAVQIAKALGAEVTGVCSTAKVDLVRSLGADHVRSYEQGDVLDGDRRFDLILDAGGNRRTSRLRRALTPTGTLVVVGSETGGKVTGGFGRSLRAAALSPFVRQRLTMLVAKEHHADLLPLTEMIEAGLVTPHVDRTFSLAEVPEAMARLVAGEVRGKVAITVRP